MSACRSPLEEGLAIATQHPEWLLEKNGFNLLGSRSADGRVPEHLDEPERTATGSRLAQFPPYLAGQRVLHGPSRGESVPLKRFSSKDKVGKVDGDRPLSAHGEP